MELQKNGWMKKVFDIIEHSVMMKKNGYFVTLECEFSCIETTGEIRVDVYEYGTRNKYASFYCVEYGDYSVMLNTINKKINSELKKLGVKKINGKR